MAIFFRKLDENEKKLDQVGRASLASLLYPPMRKGFFVTVTANYPSQRQSKDFDRAEEEKRKEKRREGMKEKRILLGNTFQF